MTEQTMIGTVRLERTQMRRSMKVYAGLQKCLNRTSHGQSKTPEK